MLLCLSTIYSPNQDVSNLLIAFFVCLARGLEEEIFISPQVLYESVHSTLIKKNLVTFHSFEPSLLVGSSCAL